MTPDTLFRAFSTDSLASDICTGVSFVHRSEIKITLAAKTWHTLTVEHRGEDIRVFVGKEKVFEGRDKTYSDAGRIGLWIKADSLTYFDDPTAEELK